MRRKRNRVSGTIALTFCAMIWAVASASAIVIDFESGYATGDLTNQPSSGTTWTRTQGVANGFKVLSANSGLIVRAQDIGSTAQIYSFAPSDSDLGGTFNASSSVLDFGLKLVWRGIGSSGAGIGRFYVGGTGASAVYLGLSSNGKIHYYHGGVLKWVKDADGNDFVAAASTWYAISGKIDYGTATWTLTVNGVPQTDQAVSPSTAIDFEDATASTAEIVLFSSGVGQAYFQLIDYDVIELGMTTALSSSDKVADFETASGYTVRDLDCQPGAGAVSWLSPDSDSGIVVAADGGNQVATIKAGDAASSIYKFTITDEALGGAFNTNASVVTYSYRMRWDSVTGNDYWVSRLYLGTTTANALYFSCNVDGRLFYNNGTTHYVKASGGGDFTAITDDWYTITATLDYGTDTFSVTVDGVVQTNNAPFYSSNITEHKFSLGAFSRTNANFEEQSFDDFRASVPKGTVIAIR